MSERTESTCRLCNQALWLDLSVTNDVTGAPYYWRGDDDDTCCPEGVDYYGNGQYLHQAEMPIAVPMEMLPIEEQMASTATVFHPEAPVRKLLLEGADTIRAMKAYIRGLEDGAAILERLREAEKDASND
jgi:hypothetical protein